MADNKDDEQIVDDKKEVTDEDLAKLKADADSKEEVEVAKPDESSKEADTEKEEKPDPSDKADEEKPESPPETPSFTKKFPNIKGDDPKEYIPNLEKAYESSTSEAIRLKTENDELKTRLEEKPEQSDETAPAADPAVQYARDMMQSDANKAFEKFAGDYPQVRDLDTFDKFRSVVAKASDALAEAKGSRPTFEEAYYEAARILKWDKEDKDEKLAGAVKETAATSKTNSSTKSAPKTSVTDKEIKVGRNMFPGKSDSEIRKELETVKV